MNLNAVCKPFHYSLFFICTHRTESRDMTWRDAMLRIFHRYDFRLVFCSENQKIGMNGQQFIYTRLLPPLQYSEHFDLERCCFWTWNSINCKNLHCDTKNVDLLCFNNGREWNLGRNNNNLQLIFVKTLKSCTDYHILCATQMSIRRNIFMLNVSVIWSTQKIDFLCLF